MKAILIFAALCSFALAREGNLVWNESAPSEAIIRWEVHYGPDATSMSHMVQVRPQPAPSPGRKPSLALSDLAFMDDGKVSIAVISYNAAGLASPPSIISLEAVTNEPDDPPTPGPDPVVWVRIEDIEIAVSEDLVTWVAFSDFLTNHPGGPKTWPPKLFWSVLPKKKP